MSITALRGFNPIEAGQDFHEAITASRMQAIEGAIKDLHEGRNVSVGPGLRKGISAHGLSIKERRRRRGGGAGAITLHPWRTTTVTSTKVQVLGGFVGSIELVTAEITVGSGTKYVYVNVTCPPNVVNSFVLGGTMSSAVFASGSTVPADTSGTYRIPLVKLEDGIVAIQYEETNLGFRLVDSGLGDGVAIAVHYPN